MVWNNICLHENCLQPQQLLREHLSTSKLQIVGSLKTFQSEQKVKYPD